MPTFEELDEEDSDSSDVEYRPSEEEESDEDESEGEKSDDNDELCVAEADVKKGTPKKVVSKTGAKSSFCSRIRQGGIFLEEETSPANKKLGTETIFETASLEKVSECEAEKASSDEAAETSLKRRSEDLWASFLADVGPPATKQSASSDYGKPVTKVTVKPKVSVTKVRSILSSVECLFSFLL